METILYVAIGIGVPLVIIDRASRKKGHRRISRTATAAIPGIATGRTVVPTAVVARAAAAAISRYSCKS